MLNIELLPLIGNSYQVDCPYCGKLNRVTLVSLKYGFVHADGLSFECEHYGFTDFTDNQVKLGFHKTLTPLQGFQWIAPTQIFRSNISNLAGR